MCGDRNDGRHDAARCQKVRQQETRAAECRHPDTATRNALCANGHPTRECESHNACRDDGEAAVKYDDPSYHQPVPSGHEPRDEDRRPQEQRRGAADDCNAVGSVQESHSVFAFGGSPLRLFPLAVEEGERGARERSRHLAEDRAVAAIRYDP